MDDIEVPSAVSGDFRSDEVGGRTIIFGVWKKGCQCLNFFGHDQNWNVHIQRETRFAVMHGTYGTGYQIAHSGVFKRSNEEGNQVRFLHGRILWLPVGGILRQKDGGVICAWREPLFPKRFSKAPWQQPTFRQMSFRESAAVGWGAKVLGSFFRNSIKPCGDQAVSHLLCDGLESHIQQHLFHSHQ